MKKITLVSIVAAMAALVTLFLWPSVASQSLSVSRELGSTQLADVTPLVPAYIERALILEPAPQEAEPQEAEPIVSNPVVRWALRDISDQARRRIESGQKWISERLPDMNGTKDAERGWLYTEYAMALARRSVMVIFDATGRTGTPALYGIDYHDPLASPKGDYLVPIGEFPGLDRLMELRKQIWEGQFPKPDGVPKGQLPLKEVNALCNLALSYRIQ